MVEQKKKYWQTEKGKAAAKKYRQSEKGLASRKKYVDKRKSQTISEEVIQNANESEKFESASKTKEVTCIQELDSFKMC